MVSFGIDFGTTNSAGVMLQQGQVFRLGDDAGRPLPSIVSIDKAHGALTAGREVWDTQEERLQSGREIIVRSVKGGLGHGQYWQTAVGIVTAEDVAAKIFEEISRQVVKRNAPPLERAAVTIPIGFSASARAALRRAARKAGIEISTFVHEPTAALAKFYKNVRHHRHVAIFDWGGGTLDISVMRLVQHRVYEIATKGLPKAGDQIDEAMARAIHEHEMTKRGTPLSFDEVSTRDKDMLRTRCELAKCQMSACSETELLLWYAGKQLDFIVTKSWFEHLIAPFVDDAVHQLVQAISEARVNYEDIGALIIIGGTSNLLLLKERLSNDPRFSTALEYSDSPEWDVAHGAAVVNHLSGGYEVSDSVGLVLCDGQIHTLVSPGEKAYAKPRTVSLALAEDVGEANIVLTKNANGNGSGDIVMQFSVPAGGFDGERIALSYSITPDLVLDVTAQASTRAAEDSVRHQYEGLRFAYHVE